MSIESVPDHWFEAQEESPIPYGEYEVLAGTANLGRIPMSARESTFIANAAAVGASMLTGLAWYLLDLGGIYGGPWVAPIVALIIGAAIRAASEVESAYLAVLSVASYLLTLMVVLILLTHRDLTDIYESVDNFQVYETTLVRTRLQDPLHIGAYLLGAVVAARVAYFQSRG
ncbi:MAG: hypothetical protein AAF531_10840 [Actinomycetota bacterium]